MCGCNWKRLYGRKLTWWQVFYLLPKTTKLMKNEPINTHGLTVDFGKYKGELWTRIPVGYLRWCINEMLPNREAYKIAEAELKRRGDTMPITVNISNHAIDKASLRVIKNWHEDRSKDEGLYSWLARICDEALAKQPPDKTERITYKGCILIFTYGNKYPTLKTVLPYIVLPKNQPLQPGFLSDTGGV